MDKLTFISEIKPLLKAMGYRKNGNYWYKAVNDLTFCVNVQGLQWDKNDYYVNIGIAITNPSIKNPTQLHWYCTHRCRGIDGEQTNIPPAEIIRIVNDTFPADMTSAQMTSFLNKHKAQWVIGQFWF